MIKQKKKMNQETPKAQKMPSCFEKCNSMKIMKMQQGENNEK